MIDYTEVDIYGHGNDLWPVSPLNYAPKVADDNDVPSPLHAKIHTQGQREALRAVQRRIDDLEIERGQHVPRALKDTVNEMLEHLPKV